MALLASPRLQQNCHQEKWCFISVSEGTRLSLGVDRLGNELDLPPLEKKVAVDVRTGRPLCTCSFPAAQNPEEQQGQAAEKQTLVSAGSRP